MAEQTLVAHFPLGFQPENLRLLEKRKHKNLGGKVLQRSMAYFKDSTFTKALREGRL